LSLGEIANPYEKPRDLYLRLIQFIYQPDMTLVEVCSGVAPGARASSFIGISSISFDFRERQNETAKSLLIEHFSRWKTKPVRFSFYFWFIHPF